jgi:photosystem II PsbU protein
MRTVVIIICAFIGWALLSCDFSNAFTQRPITRDNANTQMSALWLRQQQKSSLGLSSLADSSRRTALQGSLLILIPTLLVSPNNAAATSKFDNARLDVNNALAREYTAFPGLFPTIASKIVKGAPYKSKKEVYAVLSDTEADRLKQYDKAIVIEKPDPLLKQFKSSQICKYECGRMSNSYQDAQIKAVQKARSVY